MTAVLLIAVLAAIAIVVHDYFSGRCLVLDVIDEIRLACADIAELDRLCRANPDRSDAVVCLTTLPSRLPLIDDTIKSLLRQTRAPAEIRLYLPRFSKREEAPYSVPPHLRGLKSLVLIENEDDHGPATKFWSAIRTAQPDQKLVILDDDRIYAAGMLARLDDAANADPAAAFCLGGWTVPADLVDRPTTMMMNIRAIPPAQLRAVRLKHRVRIDILMGCHGYLIRPRQLDLKRLFDLSRAPAAAFFADDIWISAWCRAPKYALPVRRTNFQPHRHIRRYDRSSLGWVNRTGRPETWANTKVLKWFGRDQWLAAGPVMSRQRPMAFDPAE